MSVRQSDTRPDAPLGFSRRGLLAGAAGGLAAVAAAEMPRSAAAAAGQVIRKGRINQSVCRWCYNKIPLDELAAAAAGMGLKSVELLRPRDFPTLQKQGLMCAMVSTHGITKGLNRTENHGECLQTIRSAIDAAAEAGFPNVITFSGNRAGMSDDVGLENCATALQRIVGYAEEKKVTICMELLNSKVNHKDYMCDHTLWGVELCKRVDSDRFKLLYDIYHLQIMEGDIIRTIQDYHQYIGHYHTGGNPGRHEIDETQELNYAAIMRAIVQTGYEGYVGQEFIPVRDPLTSLEQAARICDV